MGLRLLVVGDETSRRSTLAAALVELGHQVTIVSNIREGLWRLELEPFDAVLTDFSSPGLDGWLMAHNVRERWHDVRVIVLMDRVAIPRWEYWAAELADAVIRRPFTLAEAADALATVVQESSACHQDLLATPRL